MEYRVLTPILIVIAILAIGWTTLVLLWNPQPSVVNNSEEIQVAVSQNSLAPFESLQTDNEIPTAESEIADERINALPPVLDASMRIDELYRLISTLGMDPADFSARLQEFYCGGGWPPGDNQYSLAGCNLEQPYDQYDMETLQQFAENGDIWAQQFLAKRLADTRPAEAIQWYRRAAAQGSASAAENIAVIYDFARADFLRQANNTETTLLQQTLALRDASESPGTLAAAWAGASNLMARRTVGGASLGQYGSRLNSAQYERACELAEQLYDELGQEARGAKREISPRRVSPLLFAARNDHANRCSGSEWSDPDIQDCHPFILSFENVAFVSDLPQMQGWICPD